ncbi:copper resistance D family protein [Paraburkholderia fungorum]|jgi:putative copper resistance protein D|uniref:Copper resistance D family protein n=1 Tax=Paraburkholderia fungorum TaxID=134537 RepID=A0AAW3V6C2_9BURK|nr:CopD family protein [Paraburkholderia fungorum]AJZ56336.1 copper resistance D family protein [Paraburkholderia fungorum]MBB4516602.1 putative copper resistance protein D [Paraburkholderia fungorum]MBB5545140.1 putative copper resistance protein D [Paraburkholderia fungorum]MBB6204925.1 putative copper resistance protein D [Paraburkholderia fungorum]MBU7442508.1 CopD family protein [Paraburkholderia fungorum]
MNDGFLGVLRLASVALHNLGFAVLVGALLSERWLARSPSAWQAGVSRRLTRAFRVAAIVALLASVFEFWIHCALMSDSTLADAWPAVRSMIEGTGYGHTWAAGAAFLLCVAGISLMPPRAGSIRLQPVLWLALAGFAMTRSNAGHPVDAGVFSVPVWADWIHLLAISAWVGLVLVATYVVVPRFFRVPGNERTNGAAFIQSLSDTATFALIALFITGAYNGWRGVNSPGNLLDSAYGQVLLLKLAFVFIAAALGGHNRFFEMPGLMTSLTDTASASPGRPLKRFATVLHVESVVLVTVLVAAAILVSSPLPGTS